jgi:hypothetical protein
LNEPIALGRIEPLHGAFRHYLLQATLRRATIIARPKRKRAPEGAQSPQERPAGGETIGHLRRCRVVGCRLSPATERRVGACSTDQAARCAVEVGSRDGRRLAG